MERYNQQKDDLSYLNSSDSEQFKKCMEKPPHIKNLPKVKGFSYFVSDLERVSQQVRRDLKTEDKKIIWDETTRRLGRGE